MSIKDEKGCTHNGQAYPEGKELCFIAEGATSPTVHICRGAKGWEDTKIDCDPETFNSDG